MDWKALLDEFNKKLAEALKAAATPEDKAKVYAAATDALDNEARQSLIDRGVSAGATELKAARKEASDAKVEVATLKTQLAEAKSAPGGDPDLEAKKQALEQQLQDATTKHEEKVAALLKENDNMVIEAHLRDTIPHLKKMGARSEAYVDLLLESEKVKSRFEVVRDKKTNEVTEVKVKRRDQKGETIQYLHPKSDQKLSAALAEDLFSTFPDDEKGSPLDGGSGFDGGSSKAGGGKQIAERHAKVLENQSTKPNAIAVAMGKVPATPAANGSA